MSRDIGQGKPEANGKFFAPALAGSFRMQGHSSYPIQVLLHGLEGPIDKKSYTGGMMASMMGLKAEPEKAPEPDMAAQGMEMFQSWIKAGQSAQADYLKVMKSAMGQKGDAD